MIKEKKCKKFTCSYFHDGAWWGLEITAYDWKDARARVAQLGRLRLDGELYASIPAFLGGGIIARIWCYLANLFRGRSFL